MSVEIYTDGSCYPNPGNGGWAAILRHTDPATGQLYEKELSGGYTDTTNNRMEMLAAIHGLEALKRPCSVTVFSDSQYLVDAVEKNWIYRWKAAGWKRGESELKNPDLWRRLDALLELHHVRFVWVKGHAGHELNERCDVLAGEARKLYCK